MSTYNAIVVAIDGPAGAGKSSIAQRVAEAADLALVDTGAIYRTLALAAKRASIEPDAEDALGALAAELPIAFDGARVLLDGEDVSAAIRHHDMSEMASRVSRHPAVRSALLDLQRRLGRTGMGAVLEGRDIGTVVFPDAEVKVFLDASPEERARRRAQELEDKGQAVPYAQVLSDIVARDKRDRERPVAPLVAADDALIVDSTDMTLAEVVGTIVRRIDDARAHPSR